MSGDPEVSAAQMADRRESTLGALFALGAFGIWGAIPLYFKAVAGVPALEVVAHRIFWSAVYLLLAVAMARSGRASLAALKRGLSASALKVLERDQPAL